MSLTMRALARGGAVVTWWCEDDRCTAAHVEAATHVSDKNGFLWFMLLEPDGDTGARLVPERLVERVDFGLPIHFEAEPDVVFERIMPTLTEDEMTVAAMEEALDAEPPPPS